jgi:hypothetical protein
MRFQYCVRFDAGGSLRGLAFSGQRLLVDAADAGGIQTSGSATSWADMMPGVLRN